MTPRDPLEALLAEVHPLIDVDHIIQGMVELAQLERRTDFDSFAQSAAYLQARFQAAGIESRILRFPADGRTKYHCWTAPIGFRTTRALCAIAHPQAHAQVLGDRDVEPNTAIVGTGYTGPQGIEAEVVHVKKGMDLAGLDLQGKIVYCSDRNPFSIRREVIARGGRAVVSSFTDRREENHAYVKWVNTWDSQPDGWLPTAPAARENLPGLSISPEKGEILEACLAQGPVTLKLITEGTYFESELPGVFAVSEGEEPSLVLLTGHLFEQGLTDNAAGVILSLAVGEILQEFKRRHGIPRFRRSLGHFHSQECYGVLALSQYHPEIPARAFAHCNIDMIGVTDPPLGILAGLLASAGVSGFLMRQVVERVGRFVPACPHEFKPKFDINCTLLADPLLGGVSTIQLEQVNSAWHTSRDRVGAQTLDRDSVRFAALTAAGWTVFLLSAGDRESEWLLSECMQDVEATLNGPGVPDVSIYLDIKQREMEHIVALASPVRRDALRRDVQRFIADQRRTHGKKAALVPEGTTEQVERCKRAFPRALVGGPAMNACFDADQLRDLGPPKWDSTQLILKAWADGTRSIYDITRLAMFETGRPLTLEYTLTFFEHYARQGLISLPSIDP